MPAFSLISSGMGHTDHEWSAETLAREAEGFRAAETRDPETMDLVDLCLFVGIFPKRIRAMVEGIDPHDEIGIDSAIRVGIHNLMPSLDDYAHLFVRHFYVPAQALAAE